MEKEGIKVVSGLNGPRVGPSGGIGEHGNAVSGYLNGWMTISFQRRACTVKLVICSAWIVYNLVGHSQYPRVILSLILSYFATDV
jgi:hypothetical protein